jgi:hypothetical protein
MPVVDSAFYDLRNAIWRAEKFFDCVAQLWARNVFQLYEERMLPTRPICLAAQKSRQSLNQSGLNVHQVYLVDSAAK